MDAKQPIYRETFFFAIVCQIHRNPHKFSYLRTKAIVS